MAPHDTFPQRVWHIVASIPEGYVTTYGEVARLAGSLRAARRGRRIEAPAGRVHPAMASGGQSPWRYLPHRPRSTAAASGAAGRGCAGLRQRPYRSPALSLGLLKAKSPHPGRSELTGRQELRSAGPEPASGRHECRRFITVCTVSVININWPLTVIAALSRMRAFG